MLREFQGKGRLNYNSCELGTLDLENIHHAGLLFCPSIISRWMISLFFPCDSSGEKHIVHFGFQNVFWQLCWAGPCSLKSLWWNCALSETVGNGGKGRKMLHFELPLAQSTSVTLKSFDQKSLKKQFCNIKESRRNAEHSWLGVLEEKSIPLSWKAQHLNTGEERVKCRSPGQCLPGNIPSWPKVWHQETGETFLNQPQSGGNWKQR